MLGQASLIRVGTTLRPAIRMMNAVLGRLSQCHSHVQRSDRQIPFHPVTVPLPPLTHTAYVLPATGQSIRSIDERGPTNDAARL
ncbi:MAG: hypothetical protein ACI90E_002086 [Yoonia sp.]|jgi:hypothetical protein